MLIYIALGFGILSMGCMFAQAIFKEWARFSKVLFALHWTFAAPFFFFLYLSGKYQLIKDGYINIAGAFLLSMAIMEVLISIGVWSCGFVFEDENAA